MASMYRPLSVNKREIRVLTVLPSRPGPGLFQGIASALRLETIECTTSHISLKDANHQSYETISYVWGDPKPCRKIRIDGQVRLIPQNADMALRTLVLPDKPRVLWIDAICINQADPEERANQVALMGDIYRTTAQNLIYLGPGSRKTAHVDRQIDDFRTAIQPLVGDQSITSWLRQLQSTSSERFLDIQPAGTGPNSTWVMHFNRGIRNRSSNSFPVDGKLLPEAKLLESMYARDGPLTHLIMANPWFRRAWTLQEAVLPSASLCYLGDQRFPLDHLLEVVTWLLLIRGDYLHIQVRFSYGIRSVATLFDLRSRFEEEKHVELSRLMKISNQRQASDLRDMVFGTLGLSQSNVSRLPGLLAPDYTKSLQHVFRDATKAALLSRPTRIEALYEVHNGKDPLEETRYLPEGDLLYSHHPTLRAYHNDKPPSWVPNWMEISTDGSPPPNEGAFWTGWQRLPHVEANSIGLKKADLIFDDRPETLLLRGSIIGTIRHVSNVFDFKAQSTYSMFDALVNGLGAVPSVKNRATPESIDTSTRLAFLNSYTTALRWSQSLFEAGSFGPSCDDWIYSVARTVIADTTLHGTRSTREDLQAFMNVEHAGPGDSFWEAARRASVDRCLAMTDNNFLVLASCGTVPGDIVIRVEGAVYPFILREVDHDEFILVEHCYVDGGMPWQEKKDIVDKLPSFSARNFCLR